MTAIAKQLQDQQGRASGRVIVTIQRAGRADELITYERLLHSSAAYAEVLKREGILPGEVVILILQHGEELIYSFFGAILRGIIPAIMPFLTEKLSPERYRSDLNTLISVTRPSAIITYREFEPEVRAVFQEDSPVRAVIVADGIEPAAHTNWNSFDGIRRGPEQVVLLQHSSGTTGLQKGVGLSNQSITNQLSAYSQALGASARDVIVSWLPLYHDMGLIAGFLMPILLGIPLVLMSPFDWVRAPYRLLRAVSQYGGTLSWLPNFAYNFCAQKLRERDLEGVDLSTWRAVINCSEPVRWESHQAFYERLKPHGLRWESLQTSYAMAENVFAVTQSDLEHTPAVEEIDRESFVREGQIRSPTPNRPTIKMMSSGRPLSNTQIRVVDSASRVVPDRAVGELTIQSDCMLSGYYNRPDATAAAFDNGWLLTGDQGYISNGEVYVSGRKKDLIIVGGKNVYPQDLEALAYGVAGVHAGRAVAFGVFDVLQGTEEVVVIVESDTEEPQERERLAESIRRHVSTNSDVTLRRVAVVSPRWIIKTSSGKTARLANKEKYLKEFAA